MATIIFHCYSTSPLKQEKVFKGWGLKHLAPVHAQVHGRPEGGGKWELLPPWPRLAENSMFLDFSLWKIVCFLVLFRKKVCSCPHLEIFWPLPLEKKSADAHAQVVFFTLFKWIDLTWIIWIWDEWEDSSNQWPPLYSSYGNYACNVTTIWVMADPLMMAFVMRHFLPIFPLCFKSNVTILNEKLRPRKKSIKSWSTKW